MAKKDEAGATGVGRFGALLGVMIALGAASVAIGRDDGAARDTVKAAGLSAPPAAPRRAEASSCPALSIGALGVVEPPGGAHRIGAPGEGVIAEVAVSPGDRVLKDQVLFVMDNRSALAKVKLRKRSLELARARAAALSSEFRRKQQAVRAAEAALSAAKAAEADARDLAGIAERLKKGAALSTRERTQRRLAAAKAQAQAAEAEALRAEAAAERDALDPVAPGARVLVALAEVAEAQARMTAAQVEAERLVVRAPVAGRVLGVAVLPGERVERGAEAPVLLAAEGTAQLRVEIDALDLARFPERVEATARRRGAAEAGEISLRFARLEPLVLARSQFADALGETVDRRVAHAVFDLPKTVLSAGANHAGGLRVGELLEVRIAPPCDASPPTLALNAAR